MDQSSMAIGQGGSPLGPVPDRATAPHAPIETQPKDDAQTAAATPPVDQPALQDAVSRTRQVVQETNARLQIEIDPDLHRPVVKIVDSQTGAVIRQIPSEEMLRIAKNLDSSEGLLFKQHV